MTIRTDTSRLIAIKRYASPNEAYIDAELLRSNGVECSVEGSFAGVMLPFIQGQVRLVVAEKDADEAVQIVPGAALPEEKS